MDFDLQALSDFLLRGGHIRCGDYNYERQVEALDIASSATGFTIGFDYTDIPNGHLRWNLVYVDPECKEVHMKLFDPGLVIDLDDLSDFFPAEPPVYSVPDVAALLEDCGFQN